ncbi:MAG: glycosyltransferase family 2 protein [Xenococcaceae cyanobacterium MO_188.B32]|nr:glycosyltransferase family 2 protein [Xenococcaceae cyanobacterium MO_188.B32]
MKEDTQFSLSCSPGVSIAIPTYNEAEYIEKSIYFFIKNTYANIQEILIADGGSTDGTQDIVRKIMRKNSQVKLINNPYKIQSKALNLMLNMAKGSIFLRADAHCQYASDYVDKCVQTLLTTKAINVGGAQRFIAREAFQAGVALAAHSWLGNGGAKYRNSQYNGYADTVFLGCMWTKTLIDISGYSSQITNEDAELNQRLLNKNPEAIYVSSKIKVWYYPRKNWKSLWVQYFTYGRGRYLSTIKHPERLQLRGKLPFLFISNIVILSCFDLLFSSVDLYMKELLILIFCAVFIESLRVNLKLKSKFLKEIWRGSAESHPSFFRCWLNCGIVLITMPIAHFSGYGYQFFRNKILRISD